MEVELVGKVVLITKTDGFQKKGILLDLNNNFAKIRFRDGTPVIIPIIQVSQIILCNEYERDVNGRK